MPPKTPSSALSPAAKRNPARRAGLFVLAALAVALVLAGLVSPFASPEPDGLERVAADQGFAEKGEGTPAWNAPLPDYTLGGREGKWPKAVAGLLGTAVVFGAAYGLSRFLARRKAGHSA